MDEDADEIVGFAKQMSQLVTFVDEKEAAELTIKLNKCIREGISVVPETFDNSMLVSFWFLVKSIKDDMLFLCRNDDAKSYIDGQHCEGEGYVRSNGVDSYSVVYRLGVSGGGGLA